LSKFPNRSPKCDRTEESRNRHHGGESDLIQSPIHSQEPDSLFFSLLPDALSRKTLANSNDEKRLNPEFPGIPAPFPASGHKSADFGHDPAEFAAAAEKFAAKFPEAGKYQIWRRK